jgi:thioesterase domain-containing protein
MMTDRSMSSGDAREAVPWWLAANTGGPLPPILFLHTWGGLEPAQFDALARAVGPRQPLYAIQPPDTADLAHFDRVADWVAYERRRLDELPLRPPYRLAGWSFGGVVALELARCLLLEDVAVTTIDLIDTWIPRPFPRTARARLLKHLRAARSLPKPDRRRYVRVTAQRFPRAAATFGAYHAQRAARRLRRVADPDHPRVDPRLRAVRVPFFKYVPTKYGDHVTIYACDASVERNLGDETLGWSSWLTGGLDVVRLPGTHLSLWGAPQIAVLADALTTRVASSRAWASANN